MVYGTPVVGPPAGYQQYTGGAASAAPVPTSASSAYNPYLQSQSQVQTGYTPSTSISYASTSSGTPPNNATAYPAHSQSQSYPHPYGHTPNYADFPSMATPAILPGQAAAAPPPSTTNPSSSFATSSNSSSSLPPAVQRNLTSAEMEDKVCYDYNGTV